MAGLQTITTPVTGTVISSSTFGIPVANNCGVLANPPIARMRHSSTLSILNNTATALTWDTEDFDSVNGHSTVTNTSRYTCQTGYAGYYEIHASEWFASNATGNARELWIAVNGTAIVGSSNKTVPAATTTSPATSIITFLNAGDYVEAFVQQDSGGALSTSNSGGRAQGWFEVQWIHQ